MALTWAQVDFVAGTIRVEPDTTKSGEGSASEVLLCWG